MKILKIQNKKMLKFNFSYLAKLNSKLKITLYFNALLLKNSVFIKLVNHFIQSLMKFLIFNSLSIKDKGSKLILNQSIEFK